MPRRRAWGLAAVACISTLSLATQADDDLPPRAQWRASASSPDTPDTAAARAIDGDAATRWNGAFSPGHWWQLDLGTPARLGGLRLHWDSAFAAHYRIELSLDGQRWDTAVDATDGRGGEELLFFAPQRARFVRIAPPAATADWGAALFEVEPLPAADAAEITGLQDGPGAEHTAALWQPRTGQARMLAADGTPGGHALQIRLPRPQRLAGLEVAWAGPRGAVRLQVRTAPDGDWQPWAEDADPRGGRSRLAARQAGPIAALRLQVQSAGGRPPAIARLRLMPPAEVQTPLARYEQAAERADEGLYPPVLRRQQVNWTVVGLPAARHKSVLDEWGALEACKARPQVQVLWRDDAGRLVPVTASAPVHTLREGWMPQPSIHWQPRPGLRVQTQALAVAVQGRPVTLLRHRLHATGGAAVRGQLLLLVQPVQASPAWQGGGLATVQAMAWQGRTLRVDDKPLLRLATLPQATGVGAYGARGEGDILAHAEAGTTPGDTAARDADGLAAALVRHAVRLAPGATQDVVLAFPLDSACGDAPAAPPPDAALDDSARRFDALAARDAAAWRERLGRVRIELPDPALGRMLRAQAAYMRVNQAGPALQPGPRNYSRAFIRDGSSQALALLRLGDPQVARDYLAWTTRHALHDHGMVSPILMVDGSRATGFGAEIEHDSQGQWVHLLAGLAQLDGGAAHLRGYQSALKRVLGFLAELRQRTLQPGHAAGREAPERFAGLLAPSISHEGYSTPTHSYWDNHWGLIGWRDGAWLLDQWGDADTAAWARREHDALRDAVAASVRATMAWKGIDTVPASADLGDPDPTSVSIALEPCTPQAVLPRDALERTFERYLADVRQRDEPGRPWAYTPYEFRNVNALVHLGRRDDAAALLRTLLRDRRPAGWQVMAEVVHSRPRHPGYIGDMPHTWVGAEFVHALLGMLVCDAARGASGLTLLPGVPPTWLAGRGVTLHGLPTADGPLHLQARLAGRRLQVRLGPGLRAGTPLRVAWPWPERPRRVWVDGQAHSGATQDGLALARPFRSLVAQW